ncbi:TetR family transcriptional regulator [Tamaricihabitans halophyticus]|uniref:TetR family transcriptional regulator n=1 Tax=Tamaricihabitans halophyticus TaxID=1262583 RepID=A0A4R2QMX4_9PSEU|nr:TetR/AcrR family transcriptional regulator [Tamaricihabitans halophyticus]TCP50922.1 TetR family transcriptional regulator [Tamaricihabitans halophyticus]
MAGRPREVTDAAILRAAAEVIGRLGPAGLTLAAVAKDVGVVPGTLVQRFGSKHGLLVALAKQAANDAQAPPERAGHVNGSPIDTLYSLVIESMATMATPERFANHLAFLCLDLTDPELYAPAHAMHTAQRAVIEGLLVEAVESAELATGTDTTALAGSVQAITTGAGLSWALDRHGTLAERLRQELDTLLRPYRTTHGAELEET